MLMHAIIIKRLCNTIDKTWNDVVHSVTPKEFNFNAE